MPEPSPPCPIDLDLAAPTPSLVDLGATFPLVLALTADRDVDLTGARCMVREGERMVWEGVLGAISRFDPGSDDYDPRNGEIDTRDRTTLSLTAPRSEGTFTWTIVLPAQDVNGIALAEAATSFSFSTARHQTSLAVWDAASPVVAGASLRIKIGVKCSACCSLAGHRLVIADDAGRAIAEGAAGDTPLAGTEGLYWTEIELPAPQTCGHNRWRVSFSADHLDLPHVGASAEFSFTTTRPPQHRVCVTVVESKSRGPVAQAQVRLGDFRLATDAAGRADFHVPSGPQPLFVWEAEHSIPERLLEVDRDLDIVVEATLLPKQNYYDRWDG